MNVGFIGLGLMGGSMASNLQAAGHSLCVHDLRRESAAPHLATGAVWKDTPARGGRSRRCRLHLAARPARGHRGGHRSRTACSRACGAARALRPLDQLARGGAAAARLFAARGVARPRRAGQRRTRRARSRGGSRSGWAATAPSTTGIGRCSRRWAISPTTWARSGAGAVAKLVHNCASFTIRAALAEVFCMGVKAGVEPDLLWQAVRQGDSGRARTFDVLADKFLPGTFDPPSFALKLGHKDVSLATELGREVGVPMRLANLALSRDDGSPRSRLGRPRLQRLHAARGGARGGQDRRAAVSACGRSSSATGRDGLAPAADRDGCGSRRSRPRGARRCTSRRARGAPHANRPPALRRHGRARGRARGGGGAARDGAGGGSGAGSAASTRTTSWSSLTTPSRSPTPSAPRPPASWRGAATDGSASSAAPSTRSASRRCWGSPSRSSRPVTTPARRSGSLSGPTARPRRRGSWCG